MLEILGVFFGMISTLLTLMVLYCVGMGIAVDPAWFFVGLGVLFSDIVAVALTKVCFS